MSRPHARSRTSEQSPKPTLRTLAHDKELQVAMQALENSTASAYLEEQPIASEGNVDIPNLSIADHFLKPASREYDKEKNKDKKICPEDITIPQWISANARILTRYIRRGMRQSEIIKYLLYTVKLGDYLQVSDAPSVMVLDDDHRRNVSHGDTSCCCGLTESKTVNHDYS